MRLLLSVFLLTASTLIASITASPIPCQPRRESECEGQGEACTASLCTRNAQMDPYYVTPSPFISVSEKDWGKWQGWSFLFGKTYPESKQRRTLPDLALICGDNCRMKSSTNESSFAASADGSINRDSGPIVAWKAMLMGKKVTDPTASSIASFLREELLAGKESSDWAVRSSRDKTVDPIGQIGYAVR